MIGNGIIANKKDGGSSSFFLLVEGIDGNNYYYSNHHHHRKATRTRNSIEQRQQEENNLHLHLSKKNFVSFQNKINRIMSTTSMRGGSTYDNNNNNNDGYNTNANANGNANGNNDVNNNYYDENLDYGSSPHQQEREYFQDRIDAWKQEQEKEQQKYAAYYTDQGQQSQEEQQQSGSTGTGTGTTPAPSINPPIPNSFLVSVSKPARAIIFFLLGWRNLVLYEMADTKFKGLRRIILTLTVVTLFFANAFGFLMSFLQQPTTSSSSELKTKKRLKAILNIDKFVEVVMIIFNFLRLTIFPPKLQGRFAAGGGRTTTHREVMIANILHSMFFILQAQAFTRVNWDQGGSTTTSSSTTTMDYDTSSSQEDDYYYYPPPQEDNQQQQQPQPPQQ